MGLDESAERLPPGRRLARAATPAVIGAATAAIVSALSAAYARYLSPMRPGVRTAEGFYGWWDQSQYLLIAEVIASGRLPASPSEYQYGLGYPLLGAVALLGGFRGDPFAPVDVICFGAAGAFTFLLGYRLAARRPLSAGIAATAVLVAATPALDIAAVPWNATFVAMLTAGAIVVLLTPGRISWPAAAAVGAALGWTFATRYADAVFLGLPVAAAVIGRRGADRLRLALGAGVTALVLVGGVLATHQHAFGDPLVTPYRFHVREGRGDDQSPANYSFGELPSHAAGTVLTGSDDSGRVDADPLLRQFVLLPAAAFGASVVWRRRVAHRAVAAAAVGASLVAAGFYLSFVAGGAHDLVYGNIRYFSVWFPLWAALIGVALTSGRRV